MTRPANNIILAAFEEAGHEYLEIDDLAFTADTLEQFRAALNDWAECRELSDETYGGYAAIEFDGVQVRKGDQRRAMTVIDFGDVRAAYKV